MEFRTIHFNFAKITVMKKYIVCWVVETVKENKKGRTIKTYKDEYAVFVEDSSKVNRQKAEIKFEQLYEEEVWSQNLCEIIKSSDY